MFISRGDMYLVLKGTHERVDLLLSSPDNRSPVQRGAWIFGAITLFFWSSAFTSIRVALDGYSPLHLTLLRFGVASVFFIILAPIIRLPRPRREDLWLLIVTGVCGISIYHSALNLGQVHVPAGTAGLIIGSAPVFTALLSHRFLGERLHYWGWIGIAVSFGGLGVILLGHGESLQFTVGASLILLAAITGAIYFVLVKSLVKKYSSIQVTAYATWAATIPLILYSPGFVQAVRAAPPNTTLAAIYSGIFPAAIAYITWGEALARAPASRIAPLLFITPVLSMGVAFVWIGEIPTLSSVIGGTIALAGVIIVNRLSEPRQSADQA